MNDPVETTLGQIVFDEITQDNYIFNGKDWQPMRGRDIAHSLQTYSGRFIWPLDPYEDEIDPISVAHGLACEYRYGNQSPYPYSVAWHSVALSHLVPDHLKRFALVHDAPEAYIRDIPRTIKRQEPFKTEFEKIDNHFLDIVCQKFDVQNLMDELHVFDKRMSHSEMIVWSEDNPVFMAKLNAMKAVQSEAYHKDWLQWVRDCPRTYHWQTCEKAWLTRYYELFS